MGEWVRPPRGMPSLQPNTHKRLLSEKIWAAAGPSQFEPDTDAGWELRKRNSDSFEKARAGGPSVLVLWAKERAYLLDPLFKVSFSLILTVFNINLSLYKSTVCP